MNRIDLSAVNYGVSTIVGLSLFLGFVVAKTEIESGQIFILATLNLLVLLAGGVVASRKAKSDMLINGLAAGFVAGLFLLVLALAFARLAADILLMSLLVMPVLAGVGAVLGSKIWPKPSIGG